MERTNFLSKFLFVLPIYALTACSSLHVSDEWDCPVQTGSGCIKIIEADEIAIKKLEPIENSVLDTKRQINRKIWIGSYRDSSGILHKADKYEYYGKVKQ